MKKTFAWVPELNETFIAELHCSNCRKSMQHVICLLSIEYQQQTVLIECSCSGCSCDLEYLGENKYEITKIDKKWNDRLKMKDWRNLISSLNP